MLFRDGFGDQNRFVLFHRLFPMTVRCIVSRVLVWGMLQFENFLTQAGGYDINKLLSIGPCSGIFS